MNDLATSSTPSLTQFDPTIIPYQYTVINDIRARFDYSRGVHEVLLSGSVGSAKSILMAHLAVTHCLLYPGARLMLGRKAMPDLKDTILTKVLEHMEGDLLEGTDYNYNIQSGNIAFSNRSEIICRSWADNRYLKLRSLELSAAIIEELTENDNEEFEGFYKELRARVGRLPHIKESFICCATNPDSPAHSAYGYFIAAKDVPTRHVYYSVTSENPFLPKNYIDRLLETYTEREAQRMIYGRWVEIKAEAVYYAFSDDNIINSYTVDPRYPVGLTWDFNIGSGKPMSMVLFQYIKEVFYFFEEIVIHGARTEDTLDEAHAKGLLKKTWHYTLDGDASGRHRDTRYNRSDYEIIEKYMASRDLVFENLVPGRNPPVRKRHILVNGQLKNAIGDTHIKITDNCKVLIKGLRLTKLKKGGSYIEDDSDEYQHITTAMAYAVTRIIDEPISGFTIGRMQ